MTAPDDRQMPPIRAAHIADLPGIEWLLKSNHLPTVGVAEALAHFFVAENDGTLVGVTGVEPCGTDTALLRSVAVSQESRGKGLGGQLVAHAISDAASRGVKELYLLTTTAEGYFPNFGFTSVARDAAPPDVKATAEFRGACPASATVMRLDLARRGRPPTAQVLSGV